MALTAQRLRDLLVYDPETGVFRWRAAHTNAVKAGQVAGSLMPQGYVRISITVDGERKRFMAHRLAWLYVHGGWPAGELDHRDTNRAGNAIANLREATHAQNMMNARRCRNKTGFKGVKRVKHNQTNPYVAVIKDRGWQRKLGYFPTPEQAHAAYCEAARVSFGDFWRA